MVRRARAAQRSVPSATDRACQALPWELAADSTRDRQHDEEGAGLAPSAASPEPAAAAAAAGAEGVEEGSKEQEEALQASGLGLEASFRPLSRSDSRLRTESPLDRMSRAGEPCWMAGIAFLYLKGLYPEPNLLEQLFPSRHGTPIGLVPL